MKWSSKISREGAHDTYRLWDIGTFFDYPGKLERQSFGTPARTLLFLAPGHLRDLQGFSRRLLSEWFALLPDGAVLAAHNHHEAGGGVFDELLRLAWRKCRATSS